LFHLEVAHNSQAKHCHLAYHSFTTKAGGPGAYVIKLFMKVIYCNSMVIQSFSALKLYYLGNYNGMAVNYQGKKFIIWAQWQML
jgi:hypothetical protein